MRRLRGRRAADASDGQPRRLVFLHEHDLKKSNTYPCALESLAAPRRRLRDGGTIGIFGWPRPSTRVIVSSRADQVAIVNPCRQGTLRQGPCRGQRDPRSTSTTPNYLRVWLLADYSRYGAKGYPSRSSFDLEVVVCRSSVASSRARRGLHRTMVWRRAWARPLSPRFWRPTPR